MLFLNRFDRLRSTIGGYRFLPGFSLTLKSSPGFNHNLSPSFPVRCFAGEARNIEDEIKKLVSKEKVVVFMKVRFFLNYFLYSNIILFPVEGFNLDFLKLFPSNIKVGSCRTIPSFFFWFDFQSGCRNKLIDDNYLLCSTWMTDGVNCLLS